MTSSATSSHPKPLSARLARAARDEAQSYRIIGQVHWDRSGERLRGVDSMLVCVGLGHLGAAQSALQKLTRAPGEFDAPLGRLLSKGRWAELRWLSERAFGRITERSFKFALNAWWVAEFERGRELPNLVRQDPGAAWAWGALSALPKCWSPAVAQRLTLGRDWGMLSDIARHEPKITLESCLSQYVEDWRRAGEEGLARASQDLDEIFDACLGGLNHEQGLAALGEGYCVSQAPGPTQALRALACERARAWLARSQAAEVAQGLACASEGLSPSAVRRRL